MDHTVRLNNHVDAFLTKLYGNNLQITFTCYTSINLRESLNFLIWSSSDTSLSRSNLGISFPGCFGKGCWGLGTAMSSVESQCLLASILARMLKFDLGDGGLVQGGFPSGGLVGPKPPAWALGKS